MGKLTLLIGRRLWQLLPIVIFATFVVFSLLQLVPGDPAVTLAGDYASKERIEEIRQLYGLDKPLIVQYGVWLLACDEGRSRTLAAVERAGDRPDRAAAAQHHPDRDLRAGARGAGRHSARRSGGNAGRFARRRLRHQPRLARRGAAKFLAGDHAGRVLLLAAPLFPGDRRAADLRRSARRDHACHTAGGGARHRRHCRTGAPDPQRADRSAQLAIYPHPARQGPRPVRDSVEARAAQRQRDVADAARPAGEPAVFRRGGDRGGVRHSGRRQPCRLFGDQQGFPGRAGRRPGAGDHRDPRQPRGRHPERVARSEGGAKHDRARRHRSSPAAAASAAAARPVVALDAVRPARRAQHRLSRWVCCLFRSSPPRSRPIRRPSRTSPTCCCRRAPRTGSAPTISAATC